MKVSKVCAALCSLVMFPMVMHAVEFRDNNTTATYACKDGEHVFVFGNDNHLTFTGNCGPVNVPGDRNLLEFVAVSQVITPGNANSVHWLQGTPNVSNIGNRNKIGPATPPPHRLNAVSESDRYIP